MTPEEIVHSLNCCFGFGTCEECTARGIEHDSLPCKMSCKESLGLFAADLIEQQTARIAELEAKVPRWVPVTERLPEIEQRVLVLDRQGNAMVRTLRRLAGEKEPSFRPDGLVPKLHITHWMPLPEGPKEGKV